MRLPSIFRKPKRQEIVAQAHDENLAARECTTGFEQLQRGQQDLALASLDRAIRAYPAHFDALQLRGIVALQRGELDAAISFLQRASAANPSDAGVRSNLGLALNGAGRANEAISSFKEAIRLQPDFPAAYINSSLAKRTLGQLDGALSDLLRAASISPQSAEVKSSLGDLYQQRAQHADARLAFLEAVALDPRLLSTRINLSQSLIELGEYAAALDQLDAAIALDSSAFEAHLNRALTLFKLGRLPESEVSSQRAIQLQPGNALAHANYGATLEESLQIPAAMAAYDTALAINPGDAPVHVNKGILLLLTGAFSEGWRQYDWRWQDVAWLKGKPRFNQPRWTGDVSIGGKSILVHNDQGLGDVMQFSRYIPMMVAAGAQVTLEVPEPLVGLLARASTGAMCLRVGQSRPSFDLHTTFSDLPLAFDTDLSSIPPPTRFNVDGSLVDDWSNRLGPKSRPRVGLVWQGNRQHKNDVNRSIALGLLLPSLINTIEFVCLQNELNDSDQRLLSEFGAVRCFPSELIDFEETAALCSLMDVVVTVDTSVAHLAGSLGKTTWVLLPHLPDWRWLLDQTSTPWYQSMILLRQSTRGDWSPVLDQLTVLLTALASI